MFLNFLNSTYIKLDSYAKNIGIQFVNVKFTISWKIIVSNKGICNIKFFTPVEKIHWIKDKHSLLMDIIVPIATRILNLASQSVIKVRQFTPRPDKI